MHRLPELIECPRLVLRRWLPDDAELVGAAVTASLDHLRPWMDFADDEPVSVDQRRAELVDWDARWRRGTDALYGAFLGDTVVGGCGLHRREDDPDVFHMGYWVHVDHVRQGYATEIASTLTSAACSLPGTTRVEIHHASTNARSRPIPASLGFRPDPDHPDDVPASVPGDVVVAWYVDADDWRARGDR